MNKNKEKKLIMDHTFKYYLSTDKYKKDKAKFIKEYTDKLLNALPKNDE